MALVPYRVSGRAADQSLEERLIQLGPYLISIEQDPKASRQSASLVSREAATAELDRETSNSSASREESLENVGKVVWQSGFLLADYLIRKPPFGEWAGVRVIDLGAGTGVIGIALAKAGATVLCTDLPHITPLTSANVAKNGLSEPQCKVVVHHWGSPVDDLQPLPDVIVGGDLLYAPSSHAALLDTLAELSAPDTITYLAYRTRGDSEGRFLQQLSKRGFLIRSLPVSEFHPEYQEVAEGAYHILQAIKFT